MTKKYLLEVCCGSVDDAIEARKGGADRVELNSCIFYGGLTPSLGSLIEAKRLLDIPVVAMVRPRGGGFCYTDAEFAVMEQDTEIFVRNGADGIVFGILKEDGTVDERRCEQIVKLAGKNGAIFHRAFDVTPDPFKALDTLVNLGVRRVLTAGQENTPVEGATLIKKLVKYAAGRIEILPGGGTPWNVETLVNELGCNQVHMAAFTEQRDYSVGRRPHVYFGLSLRPPEDRYDLTDKLVVQSVRIRMDQFTYL